MKQNVIMIRKMGNFDVSQRTVDGMFNATALVKAWNSDPENPQRDLSKFWESSKVKDFLEVLQEDLTTNHHTPVLGYVKSKASRGVNSGTWVHPYLFVKLAMWINPKFELQVIKFVYDELIKQRNDAGDNYISLSTSGMKLKGYNFREVATAMQWIVFNKVGKNLRQSATQEELKEMSELEKQLAYLIDNDYITSYNQLLSDMRKMYNKKYRKF